MHSDKTIIKQLLEDENGFQMSLGVFDGLSALVASQAGVKILHASGGAISRSVGFLDIGLVTMTEMLSRIDEIVMATDAPVIADADTGYGNELNAVRTAKEMYKRGVVAMHIEDQTFPKRCGQMSGVSLISPNDMCAKIKAIKDAVGDDLVIIARTDALPVDGLDAAIERMGKYLESGGDMAFIEGIHTKKQLSKVKSALGAKLLINQAQSMSGDVFDHHTLIANGVKIALYPGDLQRGAMFAMDQIARTILETGSSKKYGSSMFSNESRDEFFGKNP